MFDQLKDLYKMKKQMDEIKKQLDTITVEGESKKAVVKVLVSGSMEVRDVIFSEDFKNYTAAELGKLTKEAAGNAFEKAQKQAASQMSNMGGFPGIGN